MRLHGEFDLALTVNHRYTFAPVADDPRGWEVITDGYEYQVVQAGGQEIVTYHWHPRGRSKVTGPHLHVAATAGAVDLRRVHLVSGLVTLPAVLRCLIVELGVRPLRADWREILAADTAPI